MFESGLDVDGTECEMTVYDGTSFSVRRNAKTRKKVMNYMLTQLHDDV